MSDSCNRMAMGIFNFPLVVLVPTPLKIVALIMQPNRMKAQNFHLYFTVLSPHFSMTATIAPVISYRPNIVICNWINNSQTQCFVIVEMHGLLSWNETNAVDGTVAQSTQSRKS